MDRATFTRMDESTAADWALITAADPDWRQTFVGHLLAQLKMLGTGTGGFAVDRLTHSLQTAHRAELDGRDDAYVVCALAVVGPLAIAFYFDSVLVQIAIALASIDVLLQGRKKPAA